MARIQNSKTLDYILGDARNDVVVPRLKGIVNPAPVPSWWYNSSWCTRLIITVPSPLLKQNVLLHHWSTNKSELKGFEYISPGLVSDSRPLINPKITIDRLGYLITGPF